MYSRKRGRKVDTDQAHSSPPRSRRFGGPRIRIGFVVDWLEDTYQGAVLSGAAQAAKLRGASLIVIPGGVLGGLGKNGAERNHLYELLTPRRYDGLIVMTGTLGNHLGEDLVSSLCADFAKARVCSVAIALRDSPSVLIDNRRGTQSAIEHLVRDHNHTRIAFIRGPSANMEAEERYWAYKDVLDAHGIAFDERLVLQGDFHRQSGKAAICTLLDDRAIDTDDLDAIVAADDLMLLGAQEELKRRGIRVPEDIALMGFDDIEEARHSNPPLSSVHQPFEEQGQEAVRAVLTAISGNPNLEPILIPTTNQFRRSCGCVPEEDTSFTERPPASSSVDLVASLMRQRALIIAQLTRSAGGHFNGAGRGWETQIFDALFQEIQGEYGAFRAAYSQLLLRVFESGGDVSLGHTIVTGLRRELLVAAGENASKLRQLESLLHDARVLTSQEVERSQAVRRLRAEHWARVLSEVSTRLITSFDIGRLGEAIISQLPRLGINSCYISRYSKREHDKAEMIIGFGPWGTLDGSTNPIAFDAVNLVPATLLLEDEQVTWVVQPLSTPDERIGFVVFEYGDVEGYVYEVLRELLSAALRGATLTSSEGSGDSPV